MDANIKKQSNGMLIYVVAVLMMITTVACGSRNNINNNQDATTSEQEATDSISGPLSPVETIAKWKVHSIENLQECDLRIEYPNYIFDVTVFPESEILHKPIQIMFVLRNQKDKTPLKGQYTLYLGNLHPIEGDNDTGTQWKISGEDAWKALGIMDNGSFTIKVVNNKDDQVYSFSVGNQSNGAIEAYNQLLKLYNSNY